MGSNSGTCPHCSIRKKSDSMFILLNPIALPLLNLNRLSALVVILHAVACTSRIYSHVVLRMIVTRKSVVKTMEEVWEGICTQQRAAFARCVKKDERPSWKRSFRLWGEGSARNALLHSHEDLCLDAQHHACKLHQFISAIQVFGRCRQEDLWSALSSLAELVSSRITERHWSLNIRWEVTGDNWTAASGRHTQI